MLTITQILRARGVVEKFVEFFGPGLASMTVADRATIGNMAPEYGATIGFFPIDDQTLTYLRLTGRDAGQIDLVERYAKEQGLWRQNMTEPEFTEVLELDLSTIAPSVAGPRRPQDRVELRSVRKSFRGALTDTFKKTAADGTAIRAEQFVNGNAAAVKESAIATMDGKSIPMTHGDVVIAAITSCTNTSNPSVMIAAGLLAKKAVEHGLKVPVYVKTSLSPGSRVVTDYFNKAGLQTYLDQLGFQTTGYGCMTCIGNSGPLPEPISDAVEAGDLVACSVLSGNRNFEGRINPHVKANYLASPPLVVAYALAGTMDINIMDDPIAKNDQGEPVYLRDIWPSQQEVSSTIAACVSPDQFLKQYGNVADGNPEWNDIPVKGGELFNFDESSTYIQEPPFFTTLNTGVTTIKPIAGAKVLVMVGDSVTTDHISPAGSIKKDGPAGKYLMEHGVAVLDFNSYGSRRGNDRVMTRGTFANIRLKNLLAPGTEGGVTKYLPTGETMPIYDASMKYQADKIPLDGAGRQRLRHGLQPRLGRQGRLSAGREGRHRRELRTHPPQQPGRHGRASAGLQEGPNPHHAGPHRRGDVRHLDRRRTQTPAGRDRDRHSTRW